MSTQIDLGPVLSVPKGDWNANTTYERLNMVRHNSASWICNVATSKGVEPTEDSTDWYLQVKDTSSVTSVNGMKGDVVIELTETETPPANDNSNRIATTEWVVDKLGDVDLSGIKDDTVLAALNASSIDNGTGELTVAEISAELARLSEQVDNRNVGDLWFGFDPKSKPANVQLFAGQLLSRISYTAHTELVFSGKRTVISESEWQAQVSANGFCPYYSSGDGSTTYRMPLIKGVHPQFVAALAEAGQYVAAGLPNITGYLPQEAGNYTFEGAFYRNARTTAADRLSGSVTGYNSINFDASRSNPIYGNSDTVQPPSVTCVLGEYVVGSVATLGEATAESLLAGQTLLEGQVGALEGLKSGSGFNATGKSTIVGWGMPDYSAGVKLTNNTDFTVPANGIILASGNTSKSAYSRYYINGVEVMCGEYSGAAYTPFMVIISAYKGEIHQVRCSEKLFDVSAFYPLKGA